MAKKPKRIVGLVHMGPVTMRGRWDAPPPEKPRPKVGENVTIHIGRKRIRAVVIEERLDAIAGEVKQTLRILPTRKPLTVV